MSTQQAFHTGLPWKIHRNSRGWPRWWQRWHEAWLVVTGRYTFWHAYDQGKHDGATNEYMRVVINGGDLVPVLDAAIYATCARISHCEPQAELMCDFRRSAWERYESDRAALAQLSASART